MKTLFNLTKKVTYSLIGLLFLASCTDNNELPLSKNQKIKITVDSQIINESNNVYDFGEVEFEDYKTKDFAITNISDSRINIESFEFLDNETEEFSTNGMPQYLEPNLYV